MDAALTRVLWQFCPDGARAHWSHIAGGALFLPFLPMLPIQILLNNLIYDFSETTIPLDRVDEALLTHPRRWDIGVVRRFMFVLGPISSLFDFLTNH